MPRFFVASSDVALCNGGITITVTGSDADHITKSLRMRPGERVTVCDGEGYEYDCVVSSVGKTVLLRADSKTASLNEPPYRAVVYQSLVRGEKFDTVVQKSIEMGAAEIVPVISSRCTVRIEKAEYTRKTERWQKIAREASKQCGRSIIPLVREPVMFRDAICQAAAADLPLFCYEGSGTGPLRKIAAEADAPRSISIVIGPEGGFSSEEAVFAADGGMRMVSLGNRILRTETAALFALACLSYEYEL